LDCRDAAFLERGTFAVDFADGRRGRHNIESGLMRHNLLGSRIGSSGACVVHDPQCGVPAIAGNRGKSKGRLKTTPVLG
jgi:hypothetical protein